MATKIDASEFVQVWESASSVTEVANHFNTTNAIASVKASQLRKKFREAGYEGLKEFPKGGGANALDIASLASIAGLSRS
jgi:hypothetical protein